MPAKPAHAQRDNRSSGAWPPVGNELWATEPETFGAKLREALKIRRVTQKALAQALGINQPSVSAWVCDRTVPGNAEMVFLAEVFLSSPPGHLSRSLGYLPVTVEETARVPVDVAIRHDPYLDDSLKAVLSGTYQMMLHTMTAQGKRTFAN